LVDELGGLADAVAEVKRRAKVHGEVELDVPNTVFSITKVVSGGVSVDPLAHIEALKARLIRLEREPLALMPRSFEIRP
jgi:hypothetical protein